MSRWLIVLPLVFATAVCHAEGILKVGTYQLTHDVQYLGGQDVHFYEVPSTTVGLSLESAPSQHKLSYGLEVFHVAYDIDASASGVNDGQMSNSALLANLKWRLFPQALLKPFLGVGAGLAYVDFDIQESSGYFYEESLGLAGQAFGGLEWQAPRGRFGLLGELKYYGALTDVDAAGAAAFLGFSMQID